MADDGARNGGGAGALLEALGGKELLVPAVLSAAGSLAAAKAPGLVRRLTESTERKGEEEAKRIGEKGAEGATRKLEQGGGGLAGKALSKAFGGGGGGGGGGQKKTRRLPVERWTDVAVPVEQAYEAWTKFDEYPRFMHRVLNVEQEDGDTVRWQEKIWFSSRDWEGRITDRRPNDRIAWETTNGMSHRGVVSFHRLDDRLTRILVTMDFEPSGMVEKMASGLRFVKRAVQADLARFKAFVEFEDAEGLEYGPGKQQEEKRPSRRRGGGDDEQRGEERQARENRREERRTAAR